MPKLCGGCPWAQVWWGPHLLVVQKLNQVYFNKILERLVVTGALYCESEGVLNLNVKQLVKKMSQLGKRGTRTHITGESLGTKSQPLGNFLEIAILTPFGSNFVPFKSYLKAS